MTLFCCNQTYIDGCLNAVLHSSAFNADLRHATQHSLHFFGHVLRCILFFHKKQQVCSDLFSFGKPIRGQVYKYRLKCILYAQFIHTLLLFMHSEEYIHYHLLLLVRHPWLWPPTKKLVQLVLCW